MNIDILNTLKDEKRGGGYLDKFINKLENIFSEVTTSLEKQKNDMECDAEKGELFYVYAYTPEKVYITKQKSNKVELLENVSDDFKKELAEGFILRYKNGEYSVDEELTEKSMNFEMDFDNYVE